MILKIGKEFARGPRDQRLKNKNSTIMVVVKPSHLHTNFRTIPITPKLLYEVRLVNRLTIFNLISLLEIDGDTVMKC